MHRGFYNSIRKFAFTAIAAVSCFFFSAQTQAQTFDLALRSQVDTTTASVGDTVTFTIILLNEGHDTVTNIEVKNPAPLGAIFDEAFPERGMYSAGTGIWSIDTLLGAKDSLTLDIRYVVAEQGVIYNLAEITAPLLGDTDSAGDNGDLFEDDITSSCTSILVDLYCGNRLKLTAPSGFTGYQWFESGMILVGQTFDTLVLDSAGIYTFTTTETNMGCSASLCCPVYVVEDCQFDLALRKELAEAGPFMLGDTVSYNITVYNQGTVDATDVVVKDYLPAGMLLIDTDWNADSTYTLGDLAAETEMVINLDLKIDPGFTGTQLTNNAEIIEASNPEGLIDEDGDLAIINGFSGDAGELATDNNIDDEFSGTPGTADHPGDADDYDLAQITVGQVFDLVLNKGLAESGPFMPGDTVTFTITVNNAGSVDATDVKVTDNIPTGLTLVDPDWATDTILLGDIDAGDFAQINIDLKIDEDFTGTMILNEAEITDAKNALDLPDEQNEIDYVDDEPLPITQDFDLALTKVAAESGPFAAGDTVTFTITVFNQGTVEATGVEVTDYVSSNMLNVDADWLGSNVYTIGTVSAGGTASVDIDLKIADGFMGSTLTNTAEITAASNALGLPDEDSDLTTPNGSSDDETELLTDGDIDDEFPGTPGMADNGSDIDDYDLAQISITQDFDLALTKVAAESGPFAAGDTVTFTITVFNQGTVEATGVEVTDYVSSNMLNVDADWLGSNVYTIGTVSAGGTASVDIDLKIADGFMGSTLTNTAEITAASNALGLPDEDSDLTTPNGSSDDETELLTDGDIDDEFPGTPGMADNGSDIDDYDLAQISITQDFDLALTKVAAESGPFAAGDTVTFTITVFNQGTVEATGVEVTDYVSSNMLNVDADWLGSNVYTIGTVSAGGTASVDIDLKIADGFMGSTLTNTAEITAASNALGLPDEDSDLTTPNGSSDDETELLTDGDIDDEFPGTPGMADNGSDIDDYDLAQISITQDFDLALTKVAAESGPFAAGDTVTFTITVFNQGTVEATGVEVTDYVSSNMLNVDADWSGSNVYTIGTVSAGGTASVDIDLKIADGFMGSTLTNTAEITAASNALGLPDEDSDLTTPNGSSDDETELLTDGDIDDEFPGTPGMADNGSDIDDYDLAQISIGQDFDLALTKVAAESGPFAAGDTVTFTITVFNQGTVEATGVEVTDYVSSNMLNVDADWSGSNVYTIGTVSAGGTASVDIDLKIADGFMGSTLTNTAEITAASNALGLPDEDSDLTTPNGSSDDETELLTDGDIDDEFPGTPGMADNGSDIDDYDLAQISIGQDFDLALTKVAAESGPFAAGDTVTFTITVFNQGTVEATGVEVTDYVSSNMLNVDADWSGSNVYTIGTVSAGGTASVDIDLKIADGFMGSTLTNTAEITAASNALGLPDEDSDLTTPNGSSDDETELLTDGDIDDEFPGTPGMADNGSDIDDYDLAQINVGNEFDLALTKVLTTTGTVVPGDTVTFRITVYNQGTVDATNVFVGEYISSFMTLADPDWTGPIYSIGNLAAGAESFVDVDVRINEDFQGDLITNNAEIVNGGNALGLTDSDSDLAIPHGSPDDDSEVGTDNDIADNSTGGVDNPNDADDYDPAQVTVTQEFDLALEKIAEVGTFAPGDTVTYTITVFNQGTVDATEVIIEDYVSTNMENVDPDWFGNTDTIAFIAAGTSVSVDIDLKINTDFQGASIINNAEIIGATNALGLPDEDGDLATVNGGSDDDSETDTDGDIDDEAPGTPGVADNGDDFDDYDPALIDVVQEFDLALTKVTAESGPFSAGDTVTFRITVFNQGSVDATGVEVTDYVSTNMEIVDADWTTGNIYTIGNVAKGSSEFVEIDLKIKDGFGGLEIINTAEITAGTNALGLLDEDSDPTTPQGTSDDNSELTSDNDIDDEYPGTPGIADNAGDIDDYDPARIEVSQGFDLALTKVLAEAGPFDAGDTVTFTITVFNQGTVNATGVEVTDYIPAHMTNVDADWAGSNVYNLGDIPAGGMASIDIDLKIAADFQGTSIVNNAEITAGGNAIGAVDEDGPLTTINGFSDDDSELDTDDDIDDEASGTPGTADNLDDADDYDPTQITVNQDFDLALEKVLAESGTFVPGDTITFQIMVFNQGTLDATGVEVTDYIPANMTNVDGAWLGSNVYTLGNIAAGSSAFVDIDLKINSNYQGTTITNTAEITAGTNALGLIDEDGDLATVDGSSDDESELLTDGDLDDEGANTPGTVDNPNDLDEYDLAQVPVTQEFDLAMTKELAESAPFYPGDTVSFTLTVYNQGTLDATDIVLKEYVPAGMELLAGAGWNLADSTYNFGNLAVGTSIGINVDLKIKSDFQGDLITNNAEIIAGTNALSLPDEDGDLAIINGSSDDTDEVVTDGDIDDEAPGTPGSVDNMNDADDYDPAQVPVTQEFDLALEKVVAESGPFMAGDTVTYTITVFNQGTVAATDVTVEDYISDDMENVDADWLGANTFNLGTIAAGATGSIDIDLKIKDAFVGTEIVNNAEIISAGNALGLTDEDGDLANVTGSKDDTSELGTDGDIDDEAPGTPGTADNPNDADDYDPARISIGNEFDLALEKVAEAGTFAAGDTVTFTITVFNQGTLEATGVEVTDYLPTGMTNVDADWLGSNVYTLGTIPVGGMASVDIDLKISDTFQDTFMINNAEITAATNALGLIDEDGDLAIITGASDDDSELDTDGDVNDEAPGTPGSADNVNDIDDIDPARIVIEQDFDLALTKIVAESGPFEKGDTVTYTITVFNQGTIDANSVAVGDYIPSGMTLVDPDWAGVPFYTLGAIAGGTQASIDIDLKISETFPGTEIFNNAEIINAVNALNLPDADTPLNIAHGSQDDNSQLATDDDVDDEAPGTPGTADNPNDVDDYDVARITIGQDFDLALTKTVAESGPFNPGDTVTYAIKVYNQGSIAATDVIIKDYVSANMELVDNDWNADSTYNVGSIAAGDSMTVEIDLKIKSDFMGVSLFNTAEIIAATNTLGLIDQDGDLANIDGNSDDSSELATDGDVDDEGANTPGTVDNPNDIDDYDLAQIDVVQDFDLALEKTAEAGTFVPGDTVTYTITVYNQGSIDATEVIIEDYVSANMENVDADWFGNTDTIALVAAGTSVSVEIDLKIKTDFQGASIVNNAEIIGATNALGAIDEDGDLATINGGSDDDSETGTDGDIDDEAPGTPGTVDNPNDADDLDPATIDVMQEFDLALAKTAAESGPFAAGDTVTYAIEVYNQGTLDATNVRIKDYVSANMELIDTDWNSDSTFLIGNLAAGTSTTILVDLKIKSGVMVETILNTAEIISGDNALGLTDEDSDLANVTGDSDDDSEFPTSGDVDDEAPGTPGTADNPNDIDDYDVTEISLGNEFDLALDKKLNGAGPFAPGDTLTFTITVYNQGTVDATNVIVRDYVPSNMTNVDADWTGDSYALGTVTAGATKSIDIDLKINNDFQGAMLTNNAEITFANNSLGLTDEDGDLTFTNGSVDDAGEIGSDNDVDDEAPGTPGTTDNPNDFDDYDLAQVPVTQTFDLALTKKAFTPGPYTAGQLVTFQITVFNQGTLDATGVVLREYVPAGMTLEDASWNLDSTYNLGALAAGGMVNIPVALRINSDFEGNSLVNNAEIIAGTNALGQLDQDSDLATINGSNGDISELGSDDDVNDEAPNTPGTVDNPNDADDYDPSQIDVEQDFDLALDKKLSSVSIGGPGFVPGSIVTYTITVYNQGSIEATGVVIKDYVSANMELVDTDWNADSTYNVGTIAAGGFATVDIDLKINDNFQGTSIFNTAEIIGGTNALGLTDEDGDLAVLDGSPDDNSEELTNNNVDDEAPGTPGTADNPNDNDEYDLHEISVGQEFDLALTKVVDESGPFAAGDTVTYKITVYNQGTLDATNVELKDHVPTGMLLIDPNWTDSTFTLGNLAAGTSMDVFIDLKIDGGFMGGIITNNAEIFSAGNALNQSDEDSDLMFEYGSVDDVSELGTDGDIDDEADGTPGTVDNPNDIDHYDLAQIAVGQEFDLALTKNVAESGPFADGDTVTFTITVYNQGSLSATDVVVKEHVPAGMELIDTDWNLADSTYTFATLAAGTSAAINVDLKIKDGFMGASIVNGAEIISATNSLGLLDEDGDLAVLDGSPDDESELPTAGDIDDEFPNTPGTVDNPNDADDLDQVRINIGHEFDVALTKTLVTLSPYLPGDTLEFAITVYNQGTLDANDVIVKDYLPANMTMISTDWFADSTFNVGTLAAGANQTIFIKLKINEDYQGNSLTNNAEIINATNSLGLPDEDGSIAIINGFSDDNSEIGTDNDVDDEASGTPGTADNPNDADDYDPAQFDVEQDFDLALDIKLATPITIGGTITQGDLITFDITVYNQGSLDATDVVIGDYLPTGTTLEDIDWNANGTYDLGNLPAGSSTTISVDVRLDANFQETMIFNNGGNHCCK